MIDSFGGVEPDVSDSAFVAPNAVVIGNVCLKSDTSIWYGAVLRGDVEKILVGARTNVQDNCVLHTDRGTPLSIGEGTVVGHGAILHGCTIGNNVLIGIGARVLNGATIEDGAVVAAGALVTEGATVSAGTVAMGTPAKSMRDATVEETSRIVQGARHYVELKNQYKISERK